MAAFGGGGSPVATQARRAPFRETNVCGFAPGSSGAGILEASGSAGQRRSLRPAEEAGDRTFRPHGTQSDQNHHSLEFESVGSRGHRSGKLSVRVYEPGV